MIGVDDFALRRRHRYATIIIDAETGERLDVLPDREAATLEAWLRGKNGVEVVCRDGSATYAEAIRRALPDAVQVSDRWHLWQNLCDKVLAEVRAHAPCWATINPPQPGGVREQTTRERWHKVHALLDSGVGLLECSRRLDLALNTVKRYTRSPTTTDAPKASTPARRRSCDRCTAEPDSTSSATASSSSDERTTSPPTTEQSQRFTVPPGSPSSQPGRSRRLRVRPGGTVSCTHGMNNYTCTHCGTVGLAEGSSRTPASTRAGTRAGSRAR